MEIYSDSSWKKLCTSTWNVVEEDLTCMVMGYSNSDDYGRWYKKSGNVSETSTNFNCTTTLTKCEESFSNKSQFCEVRPVVSVSGSSNLIREGDTVNLTCKIIQGRPKPQITWLKNNLSKGHSLSLSFNNITKEEAGLYTCEAKNRGGISAENIYISIHEKPTAKVSPKPYPTLPQGDKLRLTCSVNKATVHITWKKDGDPTIETAVIDTQLCEKTSYLVIAEVVKDDSGEYSCEARNRLGDVARSTVMIIVKLPPHLNPKLKNLSVPLNSTFETDCFKKGDLPVSVNWTKDGEALGNNNTLVIKRVTFDDGGFYRCAAENLVGKVNISFWIDVTVSPQILLSPVNQSVYDGDPVNFTCRATGVPTPKLTWTFVGGKLPLGISQNNFEGDSFVESVLEMRRATKKMDGTYKCTAENKANRTSYSTTLQVFEKPTAKLSPKPYPTLPQGDKLRLTCSVNEATVNITWKKDGDPTKETAVIDTQLYEKTSYLVIAEVVKDDSGEYSCEARNRPGDVARSTVIIIVKLPPHLNPKLKNLSVPLNSTFETDRFKKGDLPVSVNWTKDGEALGNNNTLVIKSVTFDDGGFYRCAAENLVGKVNISFWIDVTVSPQILLSQVNQSVIDGDPVNFTCRATGVPTPKLIWTFVGGKLPLGINQNNFEGDSFVESVLEMRRATKKMDGTYKCTAENKANRTSYSTTLQVFGKPTAKLSPKPYPTLTQGDKLRLTCSVNEATVNITWKKDGDPTKETAVIDMQLDETTSYLVVAKVVEEDSGEYSCEARNRLGNVACSTVVIKVKSVIPLLVWYYIVGSMAAAIVILLIGYFNLLRRKTAAATALSNQGEAIEVEYVEVDEWEIEVNRVLLQDVIGRGAFGAVWRALLSSPNGRPGNRTVASKCFTPTAGEEGRKCLMREIELGKILGKSNHPNIVKFIGCVTRQVHPILIMEHLPCGDLLGYMRKCRGINDRYYLGEGRPQVLNNYDLVLFAKQIAAGMVFLGSRGIIHRDLAARNVLLDNNYVCKVTDFGMAYQNFKYGHGKAKKGRLPIKWTAPEILLGNLAGLSILSDVWSYGIVLYEIVTLGGIPYEGWTEGNVVAQVTHGYKLPKPDHVDDKLYAIMKRCWNFDPDFRPPFENLRKRMDTYLREETYLHLLDMGSYDTIKYSKVEDLGDEDVEPSARATRNAAAKRLGKWASDRR
nr:hemicentin-2-like [Pocillopora verrucosa]